MEDGWERGKTEAVFWLIRTTNLEASGAQEPAECDPAVIIPAASSLALLTHRASSPACLGWTLCGSHSHTWSLV